MTGDKRSRPYDDIIDRPHHISAKHPPMPRRDRAAQFAPFAALTGHGAALNETARLTDGFIELSEDARAELDMKQKLIFDALALHPRITVTCFRPDESKCGGSYITLTGEVKSIDDIERVMIMESGERIPTAHVINLESDLFSGIF